MLTASSSRSLTMALAGQMSAGQPWSVKLALCSQSWVRPDTFVQSKRLLTLTGSDSVAHMAEEVEDAGVVVPRAMVWSFIINIPFTFAMVISYLFCMPSVEDAVSDPTGFPFIYVFRQATGTSGGTLGMTVVILFLITMITISAMASTSRQTFAFARDNGLPFASRLGRVSLHHLNSPPLHELLLKNLLAGPREMVSPCQLNHLHHYVYYYNLSY